MELYKEIIFPPSPLTTLACSFSQEITTPKISYFLNYNEMGVFILETFIIQRGQISRLQSQKFILYKHSCQIVAPSENANKTESERCHYSRMLIHRLSKSKIQSH